MKRLVCTLTLALAATSLLAQVRVQDPWVRATVAGQKVTGAFMQLTSPKEGKLVGVSSPVAARAEIHAMAMQNDMMTMRAMSGLELPAGKPVTLAAGGMHVMLFDVKQELKAGDSVPLTLLFVGKDGSRETLEVKAEVRPLNMTMDHHGGDHEHHHQH